MKVCLVSPALENLPIREELIAAFQRVLDSGQFILGPEVEAFERQCEAFLGVENAITVSSGTDALLLSLMALKIGPGDEVLCPAFSFFATAGCIARVGAKPVFVDVCETSFNICVEDAQRKINCKTKAILPVHLFGQSAEMDGISRLAKEHGIRVIEDAAQAIGATYRGKQVGTIGDFGTFSFFPTKNLGAFGDAGLLVTRDEALAKQARLLRNHGAQQRYFHEEVGGNFRLDALQCAMLAAKLPSLPKYTERRRANAVFYKDRLGCLQGVRMADEEICRCWPGASQHEGDAKLILPFTYSHNGHIWNQFTVRVTQPGARDSLKNHLGRAGIASEVYYPLPLHKQQCFSHLPAQQCPTAELLADQVLSLPVHPYLTEEQLELVVDAIAAWVS